MRTKVSKCKIMTFCLASAAIVVVTLVLVWVFVLNRQDKKTITGAVVTNGHGCSDIGKSILEKGGSAADAAIAALFCEGVSMPQSMGLGGGFLLTIYEKSTGIVKSLNARETAPAASNETMFAGNASLSQKGGLSVAVPGELKGYWYLHQEYGYLPWKDLVQPTIDLCNNGIYVTAFLAKTFLGRLSLLHADPVLSEIFIDPNTGSTYLEGQFIKRPRLAKTLEIIANDGVDALYNKNGSLINKFVKDIQDKGGIITAEDLINYEPEWQEPIKADLSGNQVLYTSPLPSSGPVLAFILNILDGFLDLTNLYNSGTFQRIVESFKFAYGLRTRLGDEHFVDISELIHNLTSKEFAQEIRRLIKDDSTQQNASYYFAETSGFDDHGTAHISVLAPNGDAVAVTSTINQVFGAGFASDSTGIILNDEMDDFSSPNITSYFDIPPSPNNYIMPGKRPVSSMVPTIILKDKDVVLVTGAAGGTKITTVVASIIVKHIMYNVTLSEATIEKRLHHQLFPMMIEYEEGFQLDYPELYGNLTQIGHESKLTPTSDGFSAVTVISAKNDDIEASFDNRRGGYISYVES
ncbi:glutathione hydrolase 1 proenzyme-like isoform X2 [Anthonomus grandis grandis]|uniref:glutathione hydrolase 1 proenzyme-like isoform X2 n=1 Tax=Anthonomus grandis grandis TaxID=2921223 RepID=UPI0021661929|nr:glutathione hydrolase 1 proenzyme-like isoform X2 [Anthonomus grandis grandis]